MQTFSLLYALPAALFLLLALIWSLTHKVSRPLAVLPTLSCYAICALLLVGGGQCHRVAHVKLHAMEVDLAVGKTLREIPLGGAVDSKRVEDGIDIPGLPPRALLLGWNDGRLTVKPGPGYQRGILVRSGGKIVPLEKEGVPRLTPLRSEDKITIHPTDGGEVLAHWQLGKGRYALEPGPTPRWIGADGTGAAKIASLPAQLLSIRTERHELVLTKGPGMPDGWGAMINGTPLHFSAQSQARTSYLPGGTSLAIVKGEPAAGTVVLSEKSPYRHAAHLTWESVNASQPTGYRFEMETGRIYRVGGSLTDDFYVKGAPPGAFNLSVSTAGKLQLELTDAGSEGFTDSPPKGQYPQQCDIGQAVTLGGKTLPGGAFQLLELVVATPSLSSPDHPELAEGDIETPELTTAPPARWRCAWIPNVRTTVSLKNRTINLPLFDLPLEIYTRRPWTQRVFPLAAVTSREGSVRSALIYGEPHPEFSINAVNLLQFEPGITVSRNGNALETEIPPIGLIENGAPFEVLQMVVDEEGTDAANALGHPLRPAAASTIQRVGLRRKFASLRVDLVEKGGRAVPVLRVQLVKPQIRSVPMSDVKEGLKGQGNKELQGVKFGIHDLTGFSEFPHQLTFNHLSRWFDNANADVDLRWLDLTVQDDYKKQHLSYGDVFQIGGDRRLELSITKETIPVGRLFWVGIAGILALNVAWMRSGSFWWTALIFGTALLTCTRVIFGQAALVNAPFNEEVVGPAVVAMVLAPILIGFGGYLLRGLLPGKLENRLKWLEHRLSYGWIIAVSILLLLTRIGLLFLGAKEALPIPGIRIALSIFFVPTYILLFSQACYLLWKNKEQTGAFTRGGVGRFAIVAYVLFVCQTISALGTSDLGMSLYFIPFAIILAGIGACACVEIILRWLRRSSEERKPSSWLDLVSAPALLLPVMGIAFVFLAPKQIVSLWPGLLNELSSDKELVTDSTMLRVLQFAHEDYLINLGTDSAERIAQDHAIMANYAHRGMLGTGYLQVNVLPAKAVTSLNDNVSAIFIFAQFGIIGAISVAIAYLAILISSLGADRHQNHATTWGAIISAMAFSLVSVYMMAANYGLLPFTGRNMYLLGLNSSSDLVESAVLLGLIALGLARSEALSRFTPTSSPSDEE